MRGVILLTIFIATFLTPFASGAQAPTREKSSPASQPSRVEELRAAAMDALRNGEYAAAIPRLEKLTTIAPNVAEFQANLGMAYHSARRPQDAIAPCRKALKLKPTLYFAHYFLGMSLAETGDCAGALPLLEEDYPRLNDLPLRRAIGLAGARCAMSANEPDRAVKLLQRLKHDFSNDPEVLYLSTHVFSELATRDSQQLLQDMPGSYLAHQLKAEVLEMQGNTSGAIAEYREILSKEPHLAGIHYHIGRLLLAGERDPTTVDGARKEFEEELLINAADEGAEYGLGEMAREGRRWDEAINHFGRAVKIDPNFSQALIGLGKSLISAGHATEAVETLERAAKLAPGEAVVHYQLSFAYLRVGRAEEAKKQMAVFREIRDRQESQRQAIRQGIIGNVSKPQTSEPPE